MAADFLGPDGAVVGGSYGYDGALDETDIPDWQAYLGGVGAVRGARDWRVSAVTDASAPTLVIATGQGGQDGVMDETTQAVRLTVPVPTTAGEVRNYFVVVARDWRPTPGGSSTFALRAAGTGATPPTDATSILRNPGVQADQVLALVQVRGGTTAIQAIIDRRLAGSKVYHAFGALPPASSLPFGAQVVHGNTGDTFQVMTGGDGSPALTRVALPGVRDVVVAGSIYGGLPDSSRRPGGSVKAWGDTRRNVADVIVNSAVPFRVSGHVRGVFGADDNGAATFTRWDWVVRDGEDGPIVGLRSPQGLALTAADMYARFEEIAIPVSSQVFAAGRHQFLMQAVRVTGNGLGVITTGAFSFHLAVHPAL